MRLCLFPFFSRVCTLVSFFLLVSSSPHLACVAFFLLVSFFLRTRGVQYELRGMSVDESGDNLFRKSPRLSSMEAMEAKKAGAHARAQATQG